MKNSEILLIAIIAGLMVSAHVIYGWQVIQTLRSEIEPPVRILFTLIFMSWIAYTIAIIAIGILLLKERKR